MVRSTAAQVGLRIMGNGEADGKDVVGYLLSSRFLHKILIERPENLLRRTRSRLRMESQMLFVRPQHLILNNLPSVSLSTWRRFMPSQPRAVSLLVLIVLIGTSSGGCSHGGPKLYTATGQVMFNDEPLANAGIVFFPDDPADSALLATGRTDANGKFTLVTNMRHGIAEGDYTAIVSAMKEDGPASQGQKALPQTVKAKQFQPPKLLIPKKYADAKESGLFFTVLANGKNHFEIKLSGTPPE